MAGGLEVADVFRRHGTAFRAARSEHLDRDQRRVMAAIEACRTAALGGHVRRCADCGHTAIAYNSCRNRHCPKCQGRAREAWVAARRTELLPVPYFHVVFTLPAPVGAIAFQNKAAVYAILFRAAAETLRLIAADPRHLGAEIGGVAVLHSWGQAMQHHPHVHCIVPGGGLSPDRTRWIACPPGFFLSVKVLGRLFRRLFLEVSPPPSPMADCASSASSLRSRSPAPSPPTARRCAGSTGWCTPSRPSAGQTRCWPISAATPTASPSPTAGSSP